jgi:Domain of unknown function (DUF2703)
MKLTIFAATGGIGRQLLEDPALLFCVRRCGDKTLFHNEPSHQQTTGLRRMRARRLESCSRARWLLGKSPSSLHPSRGLSVFMGELFVFQGARSAIEEGGTNKVSTTKSVPTSQTVEVDFLYLDLTTCSRCRGSDAALDAAVEIVRPVLDLVGAGIEVRKTLVETEEQARARGFVSSPTIRVNGRDIAGELIESTCECGGVDCRVWDYRGERHTEAPTGLIVEAILAEVGPSGTARSEKTPEAMPFVDVPENLKRFFAGRKAGCCGEPSDSSSCGCR